MFSKIVAVAALSASFFAIPTLLSAETVTCSVYSLNYNGRRTASGQMFSNNSLTAASKTLPFGTKLKLTNPKNGRSVVVRVNDRGPFVQGRDLSITIRAAQRLGMIKSGVQQIEMETEQAPSGARAKR